MALYAVVQACSLVFTLPLNGWMHLNVNAKSKKQALVMITLSEGMFSFFHIHVCR